MPNITTDTQLGHLLQGYRKAKGLTQGQLAQRLGISQERLSVLELNPGRITVDRLLRLLGALGLELIIQEKNGTTEAREPGPEVEW